MAPLPLLVSFLFLAIFALLCWHIWRKYSPYFAFPVYFWIDWEFISVILRGKGPQNEPLGQFFLQKHIKVIDKYRMEGMFVFWLLEPVLVIFGPEPYKFFSTEARLTSKPKWIYKFLTAISENGIFRSNGQRMRKQRKLVRSAFYPSMLKLQVSTMNVHASYLVQKLKQLKNNATDNLGALLENSILMLFFDATLGIKSDTAERDYRKERILKSAMTLLEFVIYRGFRPWLHSDFMLQFFPVGRSYLKLEKEFLDCAKQIVEDLKETYNLRIQSKNSDDMDTASREQCSKSFGDILMEEHLKDPSFTLEDLQTELITLIITGTDTATECLMWTLWLLGLHQDVQDKAYEEVKTLPDEFIQYEDTAKLTYMECVIKESLRCYCVCPFFARQTDKDLHYKNYRIPRGTTIAFVPFIFHRNPELYPEPERFNPERFAENGTYIKPWTHLPFAEGVRECVGKNYAMLEMKIFLAYVIRNFRIESLSSREEVNISWRVTLKSENPISVKFIPR